MESSTSIVLIMNTGKNTWSERHVAVIAKTKKALVEFGWAIANEKARTMGKRYVVRYVGGLEWEIKPGQDQEGEKSLRSSKLFLLSPLLSSGTKKRKNGPT